MRPSIPTLEQLRNMVIPDGMKAIGAVDLDDYYFYLQHGVLTRRDKWRDDGMSKEEPTINTVITVAEDFIAENRHYRAFVCHVKTFPHGKGFMARLYHNRMGVGRFAGNGGKVFIQRFCADAHQDAVCAAHKFLEDCTRQDLEDRRKDDLLDRILSSPVATAWYKRHKKATSNRRKAKYLANALRTALPPYRYYLSFTSVLHGLADGRITLDELNAPEAILVFGCTKEYVLSDTLPIELTWLPGNKSQYSQDTPIKPEDLTPETLALWHEFQAIIRKAESGINRTRFRVSLPYHQYVQLVLDDGSKAWYQEWKTQADYA